MNSFKQTKDQLKLDQLLEEELTHIFRWLKPINLVRIERVSKQFFHIVSKTFLEIKHITREDVTDTEDLFHKFNPVSLINRYGPSLQTIQFELLVRKDETGQQMMKCEANYFKQLAWRFPELSDVGRLSDVTIKWLQVFVKAADKKSKLRKLFIFYDVKSIHLFNPETVTRFGKQLKAIISHCRKLDKLHVGLDSGLPPFILGKFVTAFGRLMVELCSKVSRLVLYDKAACGIKEHFAQHPVTLEKLMLVSSRPSYLTDGEVYELCHFAPNVRKIAIRAEASAMKHLIALDNLEGMDLTTPDPEDIRFPASPAAARRLYGNIPQSCRQEVEKARVMLAQSKSHDAACNMAYCILP
ncbi:hypothetical protein HDE_09369 [Halotydeus destructor]|nr:hypothetical protein HDE_09369 [Halotydeus destructor]